MTSKPCNCKEPKDLGELNRMVKEEVAKTLRPKPNRRKILWLFLKYQWQTTWSAAFSYIMNGEFIPSVSEKLMIELNKEFNGEEFKIKG